MRTKNLMLAMSALAIAGCSQNEITEISPDANPAVGFEVYTGVQTRGTETNTTSIQASADAGFGVLAYKTSSSGWATDGSAVIPGFMYNEHVYKESSTASKWKYDYLRFWPTNTDKLTFFAYAPYESAPSAGTDKGIKLSAQSEQGAPTIEFNANSIGICYEGGLDGNGRPADTRTPFQKHSLRVLVTLLLKDYPGCRVCGHRDLSPDLNHNGEIEPEEWIKSCPCFDAATVLDELPANPGYL